MPAIFGIAGLNTNRRKTDQQQSIFGGLGSAGGNRTPSKGGTSIIGGLGVGSVNTARGRTSAAPTQKRTPRDPKSPKNTKKQRFGTTQRAKRVLGTQGLRATLLAKAAAVRADPKIAGDRQTLGGPKRA